MLKNLKTHFIAGLVVLAPFFLTLLFLGYLVRLTDVFIVNPVFRLLPIEVDATFKIFLTKIAIAVCVLLITCFVGLVAEKFIFKRMLSSGESFLTNIPVFNRIYLSIKEIAVAFFGDKSGVFKRVVFMEYPRKGIYALAFVTREKRWALHEATGKDLVTVFVPSPPNPATGFFVFVPKEDLIDADVTVEEGIKMVISGGAAVPPLKRKDGTGTP